MNGKICFLGYLVFSAMFRLFPLKTKNRAYTELRKGP